MGNAKKYLVPILVILVLVAGGTALAFYQQLQEVKKNPQAVSQRENEELVAEVGQLIVLPEGETPTVATVSDTEKLKDQPFFAKAQAGDKVLIYTNAKKAILYNPATDKIVEVAPVNIGAPAATPPAALTPAPKKK